MGKTTEWFDFINNGKRSLSSYHYFMPDVMANKVRKQILKDKIMYVCYTDGSATVHDDKKGGYGSFIINKSTGEELCLHEGFVNTKTGRMEIMAIIKTLQYIEDKNSEVIIYSDSRYAIGIINEGWIYKWQGEGWLDSNGCIRKNRDLCEKLLQEYTKFKGGVKLVHIKGHQKDNTNEHIYGNNVADTLADYKNFKEYKTDLL